MALVEMKCQNCGAPLTERKNGYVCPHCGSFQLFIVDQDEEISALSMPLEEFRQKIKEKQRTFILSRDGALKAVDIDSAIVRKKIEDAQSLLSEGKGYAVEEALRGVPEDNFAAERLRFLAETGARDEAELACFALDLKQCRHFADVLNLCDMQTRQTYEALEELCLENREILSQIGEGKRLLDAGLLEEGCAYANAMLQKYPTHAASWEIFIEANCKKDEKYDPFPDLEYLLSCPDSLQYGYGAEKDYYGAPRGISAAIAQRCRKIAGKKQQKNAVFYRYILRPLIVLAGIGILIGVWKLIDVLLG